jgi:hypothetical protein
VFKEGCSFAMVLKQAMSSSTYSTGLIFGGLNIWEDGE